MPRIVAQIRVQSGGRIVTVKASDSIGPEDCYEMLLHGVLHRFVTGEDVIQPVSREVKDFIIRTNLI
jgi:hypothetical protein